MKLRLLLLIVLASASLYAQKDQIAVNPRVYVNEAKDWASMESVLIAANSLPETVAGYGFDEQWAVLFGLREVERVISCLQASKVETEEGRFLRGRSIVEIARLGALMRIGETSRFKPENVEEQIGKAYSSRDLAAQVNLDRRDALRALRILSALQKAGTIKEKS